MLKEDESGSLKASVEEILFQSKKRRCVLIHVPSVQPSMSPLLTCLVLQAGSEPWTSQAGDGETLLWSLSDGSREPCWLLVYQ